MAPDSWRQPAALGEFRSRVAGVGPQIGFFFPVAGRRPALNVMHVEADHLSLLNRPPQRVKNRPAPSVSSSPALHGAPLLRRKAGRDRSRARKAEWRMTDCCAVAGNRLRRPSP